MHSTVRRFRARRRRPRKSYGLTPAQWIVFATMARFRVLVAGRRFGKTYLSVFEIIRAAASTPDSVVWYVSPTHQQAEDQVWWKLLDFIPTGLVTYKNKTKKTIHLSNGSRIQLKSAEKEQNLRGDGIDFLVIDEAAQVSEVAWTEVLRPALADRQGSALFISTPRGFNWLYDLFLRGESSDSSWASFQFTTIEGGNVTEEEAEAARSIMSDRIYRQEFLASFEALGNRVYPEFRRADHVEPVTIEDGEVIYVGQDFNVHPMASVFAVKRTDECHVFDSWEVPTSTTHEVGEMVRERFGDRSIVFCPDPSGGNRSTKTKTVGQTDFTILEEFGFEISAPNAAPPLSDRFNNTNANLRSSDGTSRVVIDPRASHLVKGLEGLTYKEGTSRPVKGPEAGQLDHVCDAFDYLLWAEFNLVQEMEAKWTRFKV